MDEQKHDRLLARARAIGAARRNGTSSAERPAPKAGLPDRSSGAHGRDVSTAAKALRDTRKLGSGKAD